jgi:hypothetical protein
MTPQRRWWPAFLKFLMSALVGGGIALMLALFLDSVLKFAGVRAALVEQIDNLVAPLLCVAVAGVGVGYAMMELAEQRARWRVANGCCGHCGYKLRGIRELEFKCPECGQPFKSIHRPDERTQV